jgi:outer membrane receptor for ferric coprogen and ferric-rhodotorulic acid
MPSGESIYESWTVVSKGIEFELNGALTDNWQLTFGATRFIAEDKTAMRSARSAAHHHEAVYPLSVANAA